MPTLRVYATLVLCTIILFSCNSKKEKATNNAAAATSIDTVQLQPDENIGLAAYSSSFTANVTQHFTAIPQKISVITAKKGLKVTVDPAALEKEDGTPVSGKIEISIAEITTSEELFKSNAATVSNGRLLSSGGSYFIGMESEGQKLQLKKGNHLRVEFPRLKENDMELFYGNRDSLGNMNWTTAEQPLAFNTMGEYIEYKPPYADSLLWKPYKTNYHLYESPNSKVIFDNRPMAVKDMVNILQKKGIDKMIDTVTLNWRDAENLSCVGNRYRMYTWKMYRVISCRDLELEKDSMAKEEKARAIYIAANKKYEEEWNRRREESSFTNQLQKYYSPSLVSRLGWINCDRFYNSPQNSEVPLELPITFTKPVIEYFIIYKSINGLTNGKLISNAKQQYALSGLPEGQAITLIAFTKYNGQLFHCKEDFVIQNNKPVKLEFKNISADEMSKIFGKNVRI